MAAVTRVKHLGKHLLPAPVRRRWSQRRHEQQAVLADQQRRQRIAHRHTQLRETDAQVRTVTHEHQEIVGRTVTHFRVSEASAHNLHLVTAALQAADIDYFLIPGRVPTRHVVGIHREDKKRALDALREHYDNSAVYAAKPGSQGTIAVGPAAYVDGALPRAVKSAQTIRFAEYLLGPQDQVLSGLDCGCDLEFWRDGAQLLDEVRAGTSGVDLSRLRVQVPEEVFRESLVAPRPNQVADLLPHSQAKPATRTVAGVEHPTFHAFTQPRVRSVNFPIDVVYTWVDGRDPQHAAKRERYRDESVPQDTRASGASRYISHDELKYSLRSLQMYAPFVRHVYLVTDDQVPEWLDPHSSWVTVVDHRDIHAEPEALPVFNSHAIGTQLHHIPGLSEHYLYFNDDVFVGRPVQPEHFFHANGIAQIPFSPAQFGIGDPYPGEPAPNSAGKNVRELLEQTHGRYITHKFKHAPHPQLRPVLEELEQRFAEDVARTARARFRDPSDIGMAATLHHHYAMLTGRAVPADIRLRYIDIGAADAHAKLSSLQASRDYDVFCLNDVDTSPERREEVSAILHTFLETSFPFPSPAERR